MINLNLKIFSLIFTVFLSVGIPVSANAQTKYVEWNGIKLLHSSRSDVEKILGLPMKNEDHLYNTEKERVLVIYADGTCKGKNADFWKARKDTVLALLVSPKEQVDVATLIGKLNERFKKEADMEMRNVFFYYNADGSIDFETELSDNGVENINFVHYTPGSNNNSLLCKSK